MQPRFLLPNRYKKIGWLLAVPSFVIGLLYLFNGYEFSLPFLKFTVPMRYVPFADPIFSTKTEQMTELNMTDELAVIGLTIGLLMVAFSKEKIEDEFVSKTRLESLQWGVIVNAILLVIGTLVVYDAAYWNVIIFNMFTPIIIFLIRFHYILYVKSGLENKGERRAA